MSEDTRNVLEVLRYQLNFIEQGGLESLGQEASPFMGTMTCLNFGLPLRSHACHECLLYDFVPPEALLNDNPCNYIPLNKEGDTIESLMRKGDQRRLREEVSNWLRATIGKLEAASMEVAAEK